MIKQAIMVLMMATVLFSCKSDDDNDVPLVPLRNLEYTQEEKDEEIARLKEFIERRGFIDVQSTQSGLHYIIERQGDGLTPTIDDTVIAHFVTTNMEKDSIIGRSNKENNEYGQALMMNNLLKGVSEGFMLVNEGSVIRMFVPGYLAYGKVGNYLGDVDPETNMMFKMELNLVLKP